MSKQSKNRVATRARDKVLRKQLEGMGVLNKDIDDLFRHGDNKDAPKTVRITYKDKSKVEFNEFEWTCFGPMITKRLLDKGLATKEKIKAA